MIFNSKTKSLQDAVDSIKRNHSGLQSRVDSHISRVALERNRENQSLRDQITELNKKLALLTEFLGVEYFQESAKGYRKVKKPTKTNKTK